jgi:hypothetical protein
MLIAIGGMTLRDWRVILIGFWRNCKGQTSLVLLLIIAILYSDLSLATKMVETKLNL